MNYKLKITAIKPVTHDTKSFILEKPEGFKFLAGQATEVAINKPGLEEEKRPFTFTSLNEDPYLEFIIKRYPDHNGITDKAHRLEVGDELIIEDPWGTINYKGSGVFIAGGAGITPFIAILRQLNKNGEIMGNKLMFSNKTKLDIILEDEFKNIFGNNPEDLILTLTDEKNDQYENRMVSEDFIREKIKDFSQNFYICGPPAMVASLKIILENLGADVDSVVFER